MLVMLLAFKTSKQVHKEVHLLCSVDSTEQSSFRRQPRSPWASAAVQRRKKRLAAQREADSKAEREAEVQADFIQDQQIPANTVHDYI